MTSDILDHALSSAGLEETKMFLSRSDSIKTELSILRDRADCCQARAQLLSDYGPEGAEKTALSAQIEQHRRAILLAISSLISVENDIQALIAKVPRQQHRFLLELRYLQHLTFFAISERLFLDERHIYKVYKNALESASVLYHVQKTALR